MGNEIIAQVLGLAATRMVRVLPGRLHDETVVDPAARALLAYTLTTSGCQRATDQYACFRLNGTAGIDVALGPTEGASLAMAGLMTCAASGEACDGGDDRNSATREFSGRHCSGYLRSRHPVCLDRFCPSWASCLPAAVRAADTEPGLTVLISTSWSAVRTVTCSKTQRQRHAEKQLQLSCQIC